MPCERLRCLLDHAFRDAVDEHLLPESDEVRYVEDAP